MTKFENRFKNIDEYKNMEVGFERIDLALSLINFDEKKLGTIIHIAGTNGKGSTATFLNQILSKNYLNTALFTSPHIMKINERISVKGKDISTIKFNSLFDENIEIIDKCNLTYFEAIFFLFIVHTIKNNVDVTILETGLGGKYDATNTSLITDKIAVFTSFSLDHTEILGDNIFKIIDDKLAIIRDYSKNFIGINHEQIRKYIRSKTDENNLLFIVDKDRNKNLYPYPYNENYELANKVASYILSEHLQTDNSLKLPQGRLEYHDNIIFDATHNMGGLIKLMKSINRSEIGYIIFTLTSNREITPFLNTLKTITNNIILTTIPDHPRSIDENKLNEIDCKTFVAPMDAWEFTQNNIESGKRVLILGSFFLIAHYKKTLGIKS